MRAVIVGAGIAGLSAAAELRSKGYDVTIYETRDYIGGNCADRALDDGTRLHLHGPHIFHTSNPRVWNFINKFSTFNDYRHHVVADTAKGYMPLPFNAVTKRRVGESDETEIEALLYVDHTEKMWGREWRDVPNPVKRSIMRVRESEESHFFDDRYQGIPSNGYQPMFEAMAEGCTVQLNCGPRDWRSDKYDLCVYTGLLDEFYDCALGRLHYKTLDIKVRSHAAHEQFPAASMIQCNRLPYTRKTDHSWWYGHQNQGVGKVTVEHPRDWKPDDVPYYPIPFGADLRLADRYEALPTDGKTVFAGRFATYSGLSMGASIAQTLLALDQFA